MNYKVAATHKLRRSKKGRWRLAPLPIEVESANRWFMFHKGSEVPSAYSVWAKVAGYLGWLALPLERGGKGMPDDCLHTIAWFVVPELVEEHLEWKKERAGIHTTSFAEFIGWAKSLMRAHVGYLPQNPWLLETLPEEFRSGDWDEMCSAQVENLENLLHSRVSEIEVARDSFAPIADVLDLSEPMEAVVDMIHRLRADRPVGNPTSEAIWGRDLMMLKLMISNPLRRRMFASLRWRPDNTGNLYQKLDGSWWIRWKTKYFKNAKGAASEVDYDSPVHENAWRDIERYLQKYRAILMRSPTDLVLLSNNQYAQKGEAHRPWKDLSERVRSLTRKYLLRCPGIGAHTFRHLVGTSIIKAAPGEIETAAKVLNDRPDTVRKHYARFRSADGTRRMNDLLGKSLNRM